MKAFFIKFVLLLLLVVILQTLVGKYDIEFKELERLDRYLREKVDVLYLGDCTDYTLSKQDKDRRTITRMLRDMNPGKRIRSIIHAAYQADIFLEFCRYIVKQEHQPKVIIIPINMRSFSPQWDRMPHYQFEKEKIILRGGLLSRLLYAFYKPLRAFRYDFRTISREEYLNTPVFDGTRQVGRIKDFEIISKDGNLEESIRRKLFLYYMFSLEAGHRKVKAMLEIARVLAAHDIRLIFYITPIDIQAGENYFPGSFGRRLKRNTSVIKELLAAQGLQVLDLSADLGSDGFSWKDRVYPSEQLSEKGRKYVAEQLNELLK
ncbi:MAG: hypothetical protein JSV88_20025 [Candidatus Aminicenantes bacterium]|nr:MAG: hypothetical protein JSV88_20025 [Candidatus Aminicenantes bacterium]